MQIEAMLIAQGSIGKPQLNLAIFEETTERLKDEASKIAAALYPAGYYRFTLYDVLGNEDGAHKQLMTFSVEQPAPIVTVR